MSYPSAALNMARPVMPSHQVISPLYPCPEVVSWADAVLWGCIVVACMFAGASVTHKRDLEIRESNCVPKTTKHFFIPVVHSPSGAVRRGSTEASLSGRQSPELWDI
jgi:hypothetical protein